MDVSDVHAALRRLFANLDSVIVGKQTAKEVVVVGFFAAGHVLLEDVPGSAKTMLARTLAQSIGGTAKRIQFVSDMLPSEITGWSWYNPKKQELELRAGPILLADVVIADEINRGPPKTQSATLEPLGERTVTIEGITHHVHDIFFVIATQNPIEFEATYPLPEAQLDRFMLQTSMGYANCQEMIEIMRRTEKLHPIHNVEQIMEPKEVLEVQRFVRENIHCDDVIRSYIADIIQATRVEAFQENGRLLLPASDRAPEMMQQAAKTYALLRACDFVKPEHVRAVAPVVLAHRVILAMNERYATGLLGKHSRAVEIIEELVAKTPLPGAPHEPAQ